MNQIQLADYGSASVLQLVNAPLPAPGPGEWLIRVEAAGVNFADVLRRRNTYFMPTPLPYVLGSEVVGEIVQAGENAASPHLPVGSRVLAILPAGGGYSEYVLADANYCVPLPPHVDSRTATAIFVQGTTAHLMLHQQAGDLEGKTVLVHAGAGGVGSLLIQLAKIAGAKVIATSSTEEKLAVVRSLGADLAINYAQPDWTDQLIAANGGEKVDLILEMVGGDIYTQSFACLKPGGTMIVYGAASGEKGYIHSEHFVDENQQVTGFNLAYFIQHKTELWQASLGAMMGLIAEGKIQVRATDTYPLADAIQAHEALENRLTTGKVVLVP